MTSLTFQFRDETANQIREVQLHRRKTSPSQMHGKKLFGQKP